METDTDGKTEADGETDTDTETEIEADTETDGETETEVVRIISDPDILGGTYVIRGTRISANRIASLFLRGFSHEEIQRCYTVTVDDIEAAVKWHLEKDNK